MSFFSRRAAGSSSAPSLISFYEGTGRDHRGRHLAEILQWNADRLESSHDYIQTLFPLPEESGVNWSAPVIDRQTFEAFRSRMELRGRLRDSFQRILWFYGFKLDYQNGEVKVIKGDNYARHSGNWDTRFDHNHLRITRIIRCLRVLGLEDEAKAFHNTLETATTRVSPRSREFWRRAAERALNLRPDLEIDDEDDTTLGPKFLRDFELQRQERLAQAGQSTFTQDQAGTKAGDDIQGEAQKDVAQGFEASEEAQTGKKAADEDQEIPGKDENALHMPEISGNFQTNGTETANGVTVNNSNQSDKGGEQVIEKVDNKKDEASTS